MPKRRSKNTEAIKSISSQLEAVKEIQAGQEETGVASGEVLESISNKVSSIVGILARNSAKVKTVETRLDTVEKDVFDILDHITTPDKKSDAAPAEGNSLESISSIATSMSAIASNLGSVENLLVRSLEGQKAAEYKKEEAALEAKDATGKPVAKKEKKKESGGFVDLIKSFFTNPAVIAAFSGLVYLILPKDVKEKINAFFTGLMTKGDSASTELSTFEKALVGAAFGLSTYLGASVLKNIGDAITTVMSLIAKASTSIGSLKKKGLKGIAKEVGEKAVKVAPAAAVGIGAAAGAGAALAGQKEPEPGKAEGGGEAKGAAGAPTPTTAPAAAPAGKASLGSGIKIGGGEGVKPGGGVGLKMPDETVGDAIKTAAKRVGVDESIMLAMAKQESGFNSSAKAGTSSAKGLYQFIDASWNEMVKKYGGQYPELSRGPMDPLASALAGALYIKENSRFLEKNGIPVNGTTIYASHFLGPGGAKTLLTSDANTDATALLPQAASANRGIFFNKDGTPKTVGQVVETLYGKVGKVAEQYAATLAPTTTATAEPSQPSTGTAIAQTSENVEAASTTPKTSIQTNVAGGVRGIPGEKGPKAPQEIPSPVANRGSLGVGTKHSTATA